MTLQFCSSFLSGFTQDFAIGYRSRQTLFLVWLNTRSILPKLPERIEVGFAIVVAPGLAFGGALDFIWTMISFQADAKRQAHTLLGRTAGREGVSMGQRYLRIRKSLGDCRLIAQRANEFQYFLEAWPGV